MDIRRQRKEQVGICFSFGELTDSLYRETSLSEYEGSIFEDFLFKKERHDQTKIE